MHQDAFISLQDTFGYAGQTDTSLPTNWTGICTIDYMSPTLEFTPPDTSFPVPTQVNTQVRAKGTVQLVLILVALGVIIGVGTGLIGMGISISEFSKPSKELTNSLKDISQQIDYLQDKMDSLVAVVLQNQCGLDLLTAVQGGIYTMLEEHCCFFTNKSGLLPDRA
jgi:hypothetical protein